MTGGQWYQNWLLAQTILSLTCYVYKTKSMILVGPIVVIVVIGKCYEPFFLLCQVLVTLLVYRLINRKCYNWWYCAGQIDKSHWPLSWWPQCLLANDESSIVFIDEVWWCGQNKSASAVCVDTHTSTTRRSTQQQPSPNTSHSRFALLSVLTSLWVHSDNSFFSFFLLVYSVSFFFWLKVSLKILTKDLFVFIPIDSTVLSVLSLYCLHHISLYT